jgi:hypothetical protein
MVQALEYLKYIILFESVLSWYADMWRGVGSLGLQYVAKGSTDSKSLRTTDLEEWVSSDLHNLRDNVSCVR